MFVVLLVPSSTNQASKVPFQPVGLAEWELCGTADFASLETSSSSFCGSCVHPSRGSRSKTRRPVMVIYLWILVVMEKVAKCKITLVHHHVYHL